MADQDRTLTGDDDPYLNTAVEVALINLRKACEERDIGHLESWQAVDHEQGKMLRIVFMSHLHGGARVRYERIIRPEGDPGMDPETRGMIFSAVFEEHLRTKEPIPLDAPDDADLVL